LRLSRARRFAATSGQRLHDLSEKVRELSQQVYERGGETVRNLRERVARKTHEVAEEDRA
jgi:hypothetical protein